MVAYKRVFEKVFDWETKLLLWKWSLTGGGRLQEVVAYKKWSLWAWGSWLLYRLMHMDWFNSYWENSDFFIPNHLCCLFKKISSHKNSSALKVEITVWSDPQSNPIWNPIQSKPSDPCFVEGRQEEKGEKICVRFVWEAVVSKPQRNTISKYFQVTPPRTTTERMKWWFWRVLFCNFEAHAFRTTSCFSLPRLFSMIHWQCEQHYSADMFLRIHWKLLKCVLWRASMPRWRIKYLLSIKIRP